MSYILSIPFTIPLGMPKDVLKTNLKYLITTIYSFYRSGNEEPTIVWTNSKYISTNVELFAFRSGYPISVKFGGFTSIANRVASVDHANTKRVTDRLIQFMGVHEEMGDRPFLHSEIDIVFLDKVVNKKTADLQFWGKTWQRPAIINDMTTDTHLLFNMVNLEIPKGEPKWANTGLYFSNVDLRKYSQEVCETLFTTDIASIVRNKPAEEIFQNLLMWANTCNVNIDYEADMNLGPSRINHKPTSVHLESLHYTHGSRPHSNPPSDVEATAESITQHEILALWHYLCAEADEKFMDNQLGVTYTTKDLYHAVEKFL